MRVRDFIHLAMLLLVGLLVNHCVFEGDVYDFNGARAENASKVIDVNEQEFEQRLDKASRELEERLESAENRADRIAGQGETPHRGSVILFNRKVTGDGLASISITYGMPETGVSEVLFGGIAGDLLVELNGAESGKLGIIAEGTSSLEEPEFSWGGGRLKIEFTQELPTRSEASLPPEIKAIEFGEHGGMRLVLEPSEAVLHLDSAVEEITIRRSGEWATLASPDWEIRLKGLQPGLKVVGANGNDLGELIAEGTTEITYAAPKESEGGAQ